MESTLNLSGLQAENPFNISQLNVGLKCSSDPFQTEGMDLRVKWSVPRLVWIRMKWSSFRLSRAWRLSFNVSVVGVCLKIKQIKSRNMLEIIMFYHNDEEEEDFVILFAIIIFRTSWSFVWKKASLLKFREWCHLRVNLTSLLLSSSLTAIS